MLTYPKSTMRVRRIPMSHVTLMPGKFYPPPNFPQSDLGRRADSRWALPQISICIWIDWHLCKTGAFSPFLHVLSDEHCLLPELGTS